MGWGSYGNRTDYIPNNTAPNVAPPASNWSRPEPPPKQQTSLPPWIILQMLGQGQQQERESFRPDQGGPSSGYAFSGGGQDFGGMRGARPTMGKQTAEYYPMGMIPTASNAEHTSQFSNKYNYSDTPSLANMVRAPWRPETWDPNNDFIGQSGVSGRRRGRGSSRRRRRLR